MKAEARKSLIANSAADFAEWLNASHSNTEAIKGNTALARFAVLSPRADAFARRLIRPLVELTIEFTRGFQKLKSDSGRAAIWDKYAGQIDPLLGGIAARHRFQKRLADETVVTGIPTFVYQPVPPKDEREVIFTQAHQNSEELAVRLNQFFDLASAGIFAAFHRCALAGCRKYFHALRPERRYCSKGCQRNEYGRPPQRKKKNAADQKVYYYTRKVLDFAKIRDVSAASQREYDRAEKNLKSAKRAQKALRPAMRAALKSR